MSEPKMSYKKQLNSKQWKRKRKEIIKRDGGQCTECDCKEKLQVHHKKYINGLMAWEVPDEYLQTLCEKCHKKKHDGVPIKNFVIKSPQKIKFELRKKKRLAMKKKKKPVYEMSRRDRNLQLLYDKQRAKMQANR